MHDQAALLLLGLGVGWLTYDAPARIKWIVIVLMAIPMLAGCGWEDKAYPLDCPNACDHRLD